MIENKTNANRAVRIRVEANSTKVDIYTKNNKFKKYKMPI